MQYGQKVKELVEELKRAEGGADLPAYNDNAVQGALQDFALHEQALQDQVQISRSETTADEVKHQLRPSLLLQKSACDRNKRGLLMYHMKRLERIQELFHWQSNSIGEASLDLKSLNPAEVDFLKSYKELVSKYTSAAIPELADLRSCSGKPPVPHDRVLTRVVDDTPFGTGPIVLESGQTVTFTKGSTYFLLHADVEEYIRTGALQPLSSEEMQTS